MQFALLLGTFFVLTLTVPADEGSLALTLILVFLVLILVGYPVLLETLSRGRSLGKLAVGLRVVRVDGGPIRFRHALTRGLAGFVIDFWALGVFGAVAVVVSLCSSDGRRVGDFLGGHAGDPRPRPGKRGLPGDRHAPGPRGLGGPARPDPAAGRPRAGEPPVPGAVRRAGARRRRTRSAGGSRSRSATRWGRRCRPGCRRGRSWRRCWRNGATATTPARSGRTRQRRPRGASVAARRRGYPGQGYAGPPQAYPAQGYSVAGTGLPGTGVCGASTGWPRAGALAAVPGARAVEPWVLLSRPRRAARRPSRTRSRRRADWPRPPQCGLRCV